MVFESVVATKGEERNSLNIQMNQSTTLAQH